MDREIGSIFKHCNNWYLVVESCGTCENCSFDSYPCASDDPGDCDSLTRKDKNSVIFINIDIDDIIKRYNNYR